MAIMIEEGTTNIALYSDPTALAQIPTNGNISIASAGAVASFFSGGMVFGDNSVSRYGYVSATFAINTTYVISAFVKMDDGLAPNPGVSGDATKDFAFNVAGGLINAQADYFSVENLGGGLYRVSAKYAVGGTVSQNWAGIVKYTTQLARTFKVSGIQVEAKAYKTSHMPTTGAIATRAAEVVTIPTAGVFTKGSATVEVDFTPTSAQIVPGKQGLLWECVIDANNYYRLMVDSSGKPFFRVRSGGTYYDTFSNSDSPLAVGTNYRIAAKLNGSTICHDTNGVKGIAGNVAYIEPVGALPNNMNLGSNTGGGGHANGIFDGLCISSIARTDADMAIRGASVEPLPVDEYTTGKMDCDGNLTIYGAVPGVTTATETLTTNPTITIGTASITYSGTLTYDEKLTIDNDKLTMYIGAVNALGSQSGSFLSLSTGANTVAYSDVGSNRANVTVTYADRWV